MPAEEVDPELVTRLRRAVALGVPLSTVAGGDDPMARTLTNMVRQEFAHAVVRWLRIGWLVETDKPPTIWAQGPDGSLVELEWDEQTRRDWHIGGADP